MVSVRSTEEMRFGDDRDKFLQEGAEMLYNMFVPEWSYSSAVEHYVDIVGGTGSNPVVTTIFV